MRRLLLLASVLALAACSGPDAGPEPEPDGGVVEDAGDATCSPPVLCYLGCVASDPGCLKGSLDRDACVCRDANGDAQEWPQPATGFVGLELAPLPAKIGLGRTLPLVVTAQFEDGPDRDVTADAVVTATPAGAIEEFEAGRWRAAEEGDVELEVSVRIGTAEHRASASFRVLREELRAVWVTRYAFKTASEIRAIVNRAADARFNVVMLQVRAHGDAYYDSDLEPWAARLGALGRDPGFDPLQVAIDAAHARGLELHAYVNAFTGWCDPDTTACGAIPASPAGEPTHVLRAHPEWIEKDKNGTTVHDGYQWLAPGIEAVRVHNTNVVRELLQKYEVDGIHLDRIRYSTAGMGWNALEREAFKAQYGTDESRFNRFRIDAVNDQVRRIHEAVLELRPTAKTSAAVWGIHTRLPGCTTSQGIDLYQDSLAWTEGGYIDALAPMIYWRAGTGDCTDYGRLLETFMARKADRAIWAGMHVRPCTSCTYERAGLEARIDVARSQNAEGVTLFASAYLDSDDAWKDLADSRFETEALVPPAQR